MNKKAFTAVLAIFALLFSLTVIQAVEMATAQNANSITINPDGSVTGTNSIQVNGATYSLASNISGSILVQKSNIVIDGNGFAILGNGTNRGIDLSNGRGQDPTRPQISNVTVKNLKMSYFYYAIDCMNTKNNTFIGNYLENCLDGFWMGGGANNLLVNNTLDNASVAINYGGTNTIINNNFVNSWLNIWLSSQPVVDKNYWSDYLTRYPYAVEIDSSGIGNTPYVYATGENQNGTINYEDSHPLMKPIEFSNSPIPTSNPVASPSLPTFVATLAESASSVYLGNPVNFTVTVQGGEEPYTYTWNLDNQTVQNASAPTFALTSQTIGEHHVYATVTDAGNNTATTLGVAFTVLSNPSATPQPSPSPSPSVPEIPSWAILPLATVASLLLGYFCVRRRKP